MNSSSNNYSYSENLFSKNNIEKNVVNSIDGANALKLDESFEIKNSEEQNALIDSFENSEENKISEQAIDLSGANNDIPAGVSIESASYMENNIDPKIEESQYKKYSIDSTIEQHTPKLFTEEQNPEEVETYKNSENNDTEILFYQDTNDDEDFEIPAFLRRQKF